MILHYLVAILIALFKESEQNDSSHHAEKQDR